MRGAYFDLMPVVVVLCLVVVAYSGPPLTLDAPLSYSLLSSCLPTLICEFTPVSRTLIISLRVPT
jgi:hypothetical protein